MATKRQDEGKEGRQASEQSEERSAQESAGSDLKEREYRDDEGNIHHHTRAYMQRHGGRAGERKE